MRRRILFLVFISSLFGGCSSPAEEDGKVMPRESAQYTLQIDTVRIETPGTLRELPYYFPSFNYSQKVFSGLDERTNTIHVYDPGFSAVQNSVSLYDAGPHAIQGNMVGGIYNHNADSIFVLQHIPNRLLIVNRDAEIIWEKDLKEVFQKEPHMERLLAFSWLDEFGIYYRDHKVYFGLRQNQAEQDYQAPVIAYFDMEQDELFTLDIYYPEFYTSNEDVGTYGFPGVTFYDQQILITFPYSSRTFIYQLDGELVKEIESPSRFKTGALPGEGESKKIHAQKNPVYYRVQPVGGGNYFIQHGVHRIPEDWENESYGFTIVYNGDFSEYFVYDKNEYPLSVNEDEFYYPIPPEQTEYQLLERYRVGEIE